MKQINRLEPDFFDDSLPVDTVVDLIGRHFASYVLSETVLKQQNLPHPTYPERPGIACCLLTWDIPSVRTDGTSMFKPCFIMPFQWKKRPDHSRKLPQGVIDAADNVLSAVTPSTGWKLHLPDELDCQDMSALNVSAHSIQASLMAACILADEGGKPQSRVMSTGKWTPSGMAKVDKIKQKALAARQLAKRATSDKPVCLFVPYQNFDSVKMLNSDTLKIKFYPVEERNCRYAMREHLKLLDTPPDDKSDYQDRIDYANRFWIASDRNLRRVFYLSHLVNDLAIRIRKTYLKDEYTRVIISLSKSYETAHLLLTVFSEARVLVLFTEETHKYVDSLRNAFSNAEFLPIRLSAEELVLDKCIHWLQAESNCAKRAVEITGGTKAVTAALIFTAQQTNSSVYYLDHDWQSGPVYGTERLRCLSWLHHGGKENKQ